MVHYYKRSQGDLFRSRLFRMIFKNRLFVPAVRVVVALVFFYAIYMGFAHPGKENSFTGALFWGIFWPFFIVTTLPIFGRIFCGVCPHGFLGRYITRFGLQRPMPKWLQNRYIGLLLLFFGWWGVYYLFPGVYRTPLGTAILFTVMTVVAFVFYFLYRDMSYCKYICPIGTPLRAFGKLSSTFFGSYRSACDNCKTFDCARSCPYGLSPFNFDKKQNMLDCTLCMECTHACEAIRYRWVPPGYALYQKFKPLAAEVWAYILILAAIPISMAFAHGLNRSKIADEMIWNRAAHWVEQSFGLGIHLGGAFAFLFAAAMTIAAAVVGMWIAAKILRRPFREIFLTLGYAFAPLFLLASMAHAWEFFLTGNSERIIEGFAWGFGVPIEAEPLVRRGTPWLQFFHVFRWIAVLWAFYILYRRFAFIDAARLRKIVAYPFAALLIFFFIGVNLYRDHILETYGRASRGMHGMQKMHGDKLFQQVDPARATLLMSGPHRHECVVCGMKLSRFYKTNHAAKEGALPRQYCSLHCLAEALLNDKEKPKELQVVDTQTLKFIPVHRAWYVVGSTKPGTMSPTSKYAFGSRKAAEAFAQKFGGRVTNFETALAIAQKELRKAQGASPDSLFYFTDRKPSAGRGGSMQMRGMGHTRGSDNRHPPRHSFYLVTGDSLTRPSCVKNPPGVFVALDRDGRQITPKVSRSGACTQITIPVPKSGYYPIYYLDKGPEKVVMAKMEYHRIDHGSEEPFHPEKIAPHTLPDLPMDLLRLRGAEEDSFYHTFHAGERLRFKVLKNGKPLPGARLLLKTQFGWQKEVRSDRNGLATIELIVDYLPQWKNFNKYFRERFLVTVSFADDNRSYRITYADSYRPSPESYRSYREALWVAIFLLTVTGGALFLYRMRIRKPYREEPIDE